MENNALNSQNDLRNKSSDKHDSKEKYFHS